MRVNSTLIPKLPFKNSASGRGVGVGTRGRSSDWYKVTNWVMVMFTISIRRLMRLGLMHPGGSDMGER